MFTRLNHATLEEKEKHEWSMKNNQSGFPVTFIGI